MLKRLAGISVPRGQKPRLSKKALAHRDFVDGPFWQHLPTFKNVSKEEFLDARFQNSQSVKSVEQLVNVIGDGVTEPFLRDLMEGLQLAPMQLRLTPYILSLIDWNNPYEDPLRIQFIPVASTHRPDHPMLSLDSLNEQRDSPTPGLVHRYDDKVLFLALDVCPVYCRFCTRSYAVGKATESVSKVEYKPIPTNWDKAFAYLLSRPEVEDVVVSGGDVYYLPASRIRIIGETLLAIPHIRRIRFATKGPAVMPMKILTDTEWTDTMIELSGTARKVDKEVSIHTHFNHENEITVYSLQAMNVLFRAGVKLRNQSVMIRGVNDSSDTLITLLKKLSYMNVQPYYVYQHDMVKGVEELRTSVSLTAEIERNVRGATAGFNTPTFVTDAPGGGGKRDIHSYDFYDETTGISVYRSPCVNEERVHLYFDPLDLLPEEGRRRWADKRQHRLMVDEALSKASLSHYAIASLE